MHGDDEQGPGELGLPPPPITMNVRGRIGAYPIVRGGDYLAVVITGEWLTVRNSLAPGSEVFLTRDDAPEISLVRHSRDRASAMRFAVDGRRVFLSLERADGRDIERRLRELGWRVVFMWG